MFDLKYQFLGECRNLKVPMRTILVMVGLTQTRPVYQESNLLSQKQSSKLELKIFNRNLSLLSVENSEI